MPITINGSGTVTGLSVGGLPDGSINNADLATDAVSTSKLLNGAVTTAKLGSAEVSGLCKAWVNFNGTGAVAIRASFNVSSITDNGTGDYTVNFTTAMPDTNYAVLVTGKRPTSGPAEFPGFFSTTLNVGSVRIGSVQPGVAFYDSAEVSVAIFR